MSSIPYFIMPNNFDHKRVQEYAVSVNDLEDIIGY